MEGRIFISYSRRDLDVVKPIKEELEASGFSCWMNLDGIESGDENFARMLGCGGPLVDTVKSGLRNSRKRKERMSW